MSKGVRLRKVAVKGWWYRANSTPGDLSMARRSSRALARYKLVKWPGVKEFSIRETKTEGPYLRDREGTFKAVVWVEDPAGYSVPSKQATRMALGRAKRAVKDFAADAFCRPGVLSFDDAACTVSRDFFAFYVTEEVMW